MLNAHTHYRDNPPATIDFTSDPPAEDILAQRLQHKIAVQARNRVAMWRAIRAQLPDNCQSADIVAAMLTGNGTK